MLSWRMLLIGLFYCCIKTGATQYQSKALFPATSRIQRGVATMVNPTFHNSFDDVHLLFEILLAGIHFEASGKFSVRDAELASLRKTQNLEVICEDIIPRKLTDIFTLISDLSNHGHLHQDDFERTLLTLVYTTQQVVNSTTEQQRDVWAESFVSLYKAIKQDLTGTN
ncbi:protein FAM180A-like [Scomber japonicus]|uniref:protein FAM180A-like n=1 Tax=Scomber japonicus TaxID=13676 RepID=UPI0023055154|nr:protein FAM180A-like [Scomber japonicus]